MDEAPQDGRGTPRWRPSLLIGNNAKLREIIERQRRGIRKVIDVITDVSVENNAKLREHIEDMGEIIIDLIEKNRRLEHKLGKRQCESLGHSDTRDSEHDSFLERGLRGLPQSSKKVKTEHSEAVKTKHSEYDGLPQSQVSTRQRGNEFNEKIQSAGFEPKAVAKARPSPSTRTTPKNV